MAVTAAGPSELNTVIEVGPSGEQALTVTRPLEGVRDAAARPRSDCDGPGV